MVFQRLRRRRLAQSVTGGGGTVGNVVSIVVLVSVTAALWVTSQWQMPLPLLAHASTVRGRGPGAASGSVGSVFTAHVLATPVQGAGRAHEEERQARVPRFPRRSSPRGAAAPGQRSPRPQSSREARGGYRDPLKHHRAIVGRDARTPWYIRVRGAILLLLIVVALGVSLAGATLLLIASGRFLLEILAG